MSPAVLIIDDDARFRALARTTLAARRYEVLEARSGREATELLAGRSVQLIILDGLLPDTDGPRWVKARRAAGDATPVLFVSAFWKSTAAELGVQGLLKKPVQPAELLAKVSKLCEVPDEGSLDLDGAGELALLTAQYRRDLPQRLELLKTTLAQLRARPADAPLRGIARRKAHEIAGTAGSFGLDAIGDACARIEEGVLALQQDARAAWERIDRALASLAQPAGGSDERATA